MNTTNELNPNRFFEKEVCRIFSFLVPERTEEIRHESPGISFVDFIGPMNIVRFGYEPYSLPWGLVIDVKTKNVEFNLPLPEQDEAGNILANPKHKSTDEALLKMHQSNIAAWLASAKPLLENWLTQNA